MRAYPYLGFIVVGISLLAASAAQPFALNPTVTSSLEADGLHLSIGFENNGFGFMIWRQAPAGVDLYRRPLGFYVVLRIELSRRLATDRNNERSDEHPFRAI